MNLIEQIEAQGISVSIHDGRVKLSPIERVTALIISEVKAHKLQIIDALRTKERLQVPCYCCGSQTFWRKKDNRGGRWICEVCHPPLPGKDKIEWLQ
jgi:hypothetical protein